MIKLTDFLNLIFLYFVVTSLLTGCPSSAVVAFLNVAKCCFLFRYLLARLQEQLSSIFHFLFCQWNDSAYCSVLNWCSWCLQEIYKKVMSSDYSELKAEIKTVDSQDSHGGGVLVLVTGSLSTKANEKRNFVQSFFLAPQEKGYFVLNDIFRYLDVETHPAAQARVESSQPASNPEPAVVHQPAPEPGEQRVVCDR